MTNFREGDPTTGIVDRHSFNEWVKGFSGKVIADPSSNKESVTVPISSGIVGETALEIHDIPWEEVPAGLQEILAMQYQSAILPRQRQTVDIVLADEDIIFTLQSPYIEKGVDTYSERRVASGVELNIDTGKWAIRQASVALDIYIDEVGKRYRQGLQPTTDELKRQILGSFRSPINMTAILPQMHDVARLFTAQRENGRIAVKRFVAQ